MSNPLTVNRTEIRKDMNMWRKGLAPLPRSYIYLHEFYAVDNLPELEAHENVRVLFTELTDDGWFDGFKRLRVVAEDRKTHALRDFHWSDSNGGSWFEKCPTGGSGLVFVPDNRHGHI